jgi:hypothetical protein
MSDPELDLEGLVRQLRGLLPTSSMCLTYSMIEGIFPPGIEDDGVKRELAEVANECFCTIKNRPEERCIIITKRP